MGMNPTRSDPARANSDSRTAIFCRTASTTSSTPRVYRRPRQRTIRCVYSTKRKWMRRKQNGRGINIAVPVLLVILFALLYQFPAQTKIHNPVNGQNTTDIHRIQRRDRIGAGIRFRPAEQEEQRDRAESGPDANHFLGGIILRVLRFHLVRKRRRQRAGRRHRLHLGLPARMVAFDRQYLCVHHHLFLFKVKPANSRYYCWGSWWPSCSESSSLPSAADWWPVSIG